MSTRAVQPILYSLSVLASLLFAGCEHMPTSPTGNETTFLSFNSEPGDWIGGGLSRRYTPENATIRALVDFGFGRLQVDVNSRDRSEWWTLHVTAPGGQALFPGAYEPVVAWTPAVSSPPSLSFSGTGRGCGAITGRFVIRSLKYGSLGEIERLNMSFVQQCEGGSGALTGEVQIIDGGSR